AGPVHLNVPLDRPLEPVVGADSPDAFAAEHPRAARGRPHAAPYVAVTARVPRVEDADLDRLAEQLRGSRRPLLIAGPTNGTELGAAAVRFAARSGIPLLADPLSGARYTEGAAANVFGAYDLFLRDPRAREVLDPDLLVRVGRSPSSAALLDFIEGTS